MSYKDKHYENILLSVEDSIAIVQLNRPKVHNSINYALLEDAYEALLGLHKDPDIRAVILTGNNRVFSIGADIESIKDLNVNEAQTFLDKVHDVMFMVEDNSKPVIAAVEGLALGGGLELVLASDIRILAKNCILGFPEINLGIFPGAGGTQRLPRNCSIALVKQFIFSGDKFNSAAAERMGIANMVVPGGEALTAAKNFAAKLAKKPPLALSAAKKVINMALSTDIKTGCNLEQINWSMLFDTEDQKEGISAFIEKRKPDFQGK